MEEKCRTEIQKAVVKLHKAIEALALRGIEVQLFFDQFKNLKVEVRDYSPIGKTQIAYEVRKRLA